MEIITILTRRITQYEEPFRPIGRKRCESIVHLIQNRWWDGAVAVAITLVTDFERGVELPAVKVNGAIGLKRLEILS